MEYQQITEYIDQLILSAGVFAPLFACLFILVESIVPVLPLFLFISINFLAFGPVYGFLISWVFTIIGCMVSFYLVRKGFSGWFERISYDQALLKKSHDYISKLDFANMTTILSIPFTPAFAMNIAAGLSKMPPKKYFASLVISKVFLVVFWGFIGTSLVESFENPKILLLIGVVMVGTFVFSKVINKYIEGVIDEKHN